jgi:hypothetical protein
MKLSRDSNDARKHDALKALFSSAFARVTDFVGLVFFWSLREHRMLRTHTRVRKKSRR